MYFSWRNGADATWKSLTSQELVHGVRIKFQRKDSFVCVSVIKEGNASSASTEKYLAPRQFLPS